MKLPFQKSKPLHDSSENHHAWLAGTAVLIGIALFGLAALLYKKCRGASPKHEYSALRLESGVEKNKYDRELRDGTYNTCSKYLANSNRYELKTHLGCIGSRENKHWFIVRDKNLDAERLLTLVPMPPSCPIEPSQLVKETVVSLFRSLQHPYIHPVLDLEFWDRDAALVSPLNPSGTLRDIIYGCSWHEEYQYKYHNKGEGLPLRQVQCLGRQILEALLFLRNRHFPPFHHLNSGNVVIQNGVARLAGLENSLFGLKPRLPASPETLAFGYVLFEMTVGYELPPPPTHLAMELERAPKIAGVLSLIFQSGHLPSIEDVLSCDLFRGVELRELRGVTGANSFTTPADVLDLMELVKYTATPASTREESMVNATRRKLEDIIEEEFEDCSESVTIDLSDLCLWVIQEALEVLTENSNLTFHLIAVSVAVSVGNTGSFIGSDLLSKAAVLIVRTLAGIVMYYWKIL